MNNDLDLESPLLLPTSPPQIPPTTAVATVYNPIITVAVILLCFYLAFGVTTYMSLRDEFTGTKTNRFVDALYFSIITLSTVGYGDIVPSTTRTKILNIVLVSIGGFALHYLMNRVVIHLLGLQERAVLACIKKTPCLIVNDVDGGIKTLWKLCLAILAVVLCVGVGTFFLYRHEKLNLIDSVYLSVISIATVGYGDLAFQTVYGRVFAVVWILISTLAVTTFFYYFAETRIGGSIVNNMSESKTRVDDKAEFILWKLEEDEKISEEDRAQVLEAYERYLDDNISPIG